MRNYIVELPEKRESLGIIKIDFLEMGYERVRLLRERFIAEKHADNRLLLLKEIFAVFDEMFVIEDVLVNFDNREGLKLLLEFVKFARNVLLHFPFFDTWEQIYISPEIAQKMMPDKQRPKGDEQSSPAEIKKPNPGRIEKYLTKNFGKPDIPFSAKYPDGVLEYSIKRSAIKPFDELTYLRDIINDFEAFIALIDLASYLFTATKQTHASKLE